MLLSILLPSAHFLSFSLHISQFYIIPQRLHHLHKGIIHHAHISNLSSSPYICIIMKAKEHLSLFLLHSLSPVFLAFLNNS